MRSRSREDRNVISNGQMYNTEINIPTGVSMSRTKMPTVRRRIAQGLARIAGFSTTFM